MTPNIQNSSNRNMSPLPQERSSQIDSSLVYHPLSCAECGASLSPKTGREKLVCRQCGHVHSFLKRADDATNFDFKKGDAVAVEWGGLWWPAHVVEVLENYMAWRVHFSGWAPAFDEVVDGARISSIDHIPEPTHPAVDADDQQRTVSKPQKEETQEMNPVAMIILIILAILIITALMLLADSVRLPVIPDHLFPPAITASNWTK